jgi:hypothetical protein
MYRTIKATSLNESGIFLAKILIYCLNLILCIEIANETYKIDLIFNKTEALQER